MSFCLLYVDLWHNNIKEIFDEVLKIKKL